MTTVRAVEPARLSAPRSPIRQLLLYGFERTSARLLRGVYYLLASFIALIGLLGLGNVLAGEGATRADLAWQSVFSIVFAVVALAVRAWAVFLEQEPASAPPSTAATR